MRKKLAVAGLLLGFLTVLSPIARGYEWNLGENIEVNLKGDLTYWARVRTGTPYSAFVTPGSTTFCSGNANFDKGSLANNAVIGTLELKAEIPHHILFGRLKGLYDFSYDDKGKFNSEIRRHAAYNITDGLEYYLEGNYGFLTYRIGKQIIQWGESMAPVFAPGVNVVSPFFMQRIANAGYTFRDWQVPTNMLWISVDPYSTLAYEFIYAPDFDPRFFLPVVGTFNSPTDVAGFGASSFGTDDQIPTTFKDKQQWGGAIRLVLPDLSYMELGLYYYHYLARFPLMDLPTSGLIPVLTMEYPEIDMIGFSFVNTIQAHDLKLQISGELAYRPNDPVQKDSFLSVILNQLVSGMPAIPGGWERANTLTWILGASRFFHDVLDFTPWTVKLSPEIEFYGKINLDHAENKFFTDPQSTAYYSILLPFECPDIIDNAVVYFEAQALGHMFSEKSKLHHFVFAARGRYGNNWEVLLGYDLVIGDAKQDPAGIFMWDRDAFTCKVTYSFI